MLLDLSAVPTTLGGTLSLGTGFHLDLGPQACLDGTGTITGAGSFDFTGGNLAATLTIAPGALMHVTGANGKDLSAFSCGTHDGKITNNGKILVDHKGPLSLGQAGTITTSSAGTFAIAPGATVTTDSCCGTKKLLVNNGTLQVTAPPTGVESGTPATLLFAPLANAGTISVANGQKLVINSGPTAFATGTSVTGAGGTTIIQAPTTTGDHPDPRLGRNARPGPERVGQRRHQHRWVRRVRLDWRDDLRHGQRAQHHPGEHLGRGQPRGHQSAERQIERAHHQWHRHRRGRHGQGRRCDRGG